MNPFIAFGGARPCLEIIPTPPRLQNMDPFIAFGGAQLSARLGHFCSCLFSEMISEALMSGHITSAQITSGHGEKGAQRKFRGIQGDIYYYQPKKLGGLPDCLIF